MLTKNKFPLKVGHKEYEHRVGQTKESIYERDWHRNRTWTLLMIVSLRHSIYKMKWHLISYISMPTEKEVTEKKMEKYQRLLNFPKSHMVVKCH